PVVIHDATLDLRADAMEYDAKQRILKLTGRVHARYISGKG
ncbi:MAG: LPS export ABC transporter periplasmic protein LptC, partial [Proteobacteria bacterium]|nr:LPS export ABC transporter periplasmic protein LptC [Pseudomonadota bacterium]